MRDTCHRNGKTIEHFGDEFFENILMSYKYMYLNLERGVLGGWNGFLTNTFEYIYGVICMHTGNLNNLFINFYSYHLVQTNKNLAFLPSNKKKAFFFFLKPQTPLYTN